MLERPDLFERRGRAFFERPHNIAAQQVVARENDFRYGSFCLHANPPQLANIGIQDAHSPLELHLSLEPFNAISVFRLAHHQEAVADPYSVIASWWCAKRKTLIALNGSRD